MSLKINSVHIMYMECTIYPRLALKCLYTISVKKWRILAKPSSEVYLAYQAHISSDVGFQICWDWRNSAASLDVMSADCPRWCQSTQMPLVQ